MGSSGGGSAPETTTTITQQELPEFLQPYSTQYIQRAFGLANAPYQQYPGSRIAEFEPEHEQALGMTTSQALYGVPGSTEAYQNFANTLGGGFMGANPWLDDMYARGARGMVDAYRYGTQPSIDAQAVMARNFGGSPHAQYSDMARWQLGENLGSYASQLYGGAYDAERARQMQALSLYPTMQQAGFTNAEALAGVGDVIMQRNQDLINAQIQDYEAARMWPYQQLDVMGGAINAAAGGGGTTTQTSPSYFRGSPVAGMLGGGVAGYGIGHALQGAGYNVNPWLTGGLGAAGGFFL